MLQKVVSSMEDKMKNMLSGYLGSNNHKGNDMTQEEIQEVENEVSKRLENEVGNQLHMEGQQITNDVLQQQQNQEMNFDNQQVSSNIDEGQQEEQNGNAITNIIQQKLSSAGTTLKDNMNSLMENIEKQVLNERGVDVTNEDIHSLNEQEDPKEEEQNNVADTTHENDLNQEQIMDPMDNSATPNAVVENGMRRDDNPSNAIEQQQSEIEQPEDTKENQNEPKEEAVNEGKQMTNEDKENESKEDEAVNEEKQQNKDQQQQHNRFRKANNN